MISADMVQKVARLARIRVSEENIPLLQKKLESVVNYFRSIQEVSTDGVEPLFSPVESMELRADDPEAPLKVEDLLSVAPDSSEGAFRIPRVVGQES